MSRLRWLLLRLLAVIGLVHVVDAIVLAWLWRHRGAVVRSLAQAAAEEARRPRR